MRPTLFYRKGDEMLAVEIGNGPPITIGMPRRILSRPYNQSNGFWPNYDVTSDGRRLVMIRGTAEEVPSHVNVLLNWLAPTATQ